MEGPKTTTEVRLPTATIVKLLATAVLVYCTILLWPAIIYFVLAVLLAITLEPIVAWGERHRLPRWAGVAFITLAMLGIIAAFSALILPPVVGELSSVLGNFPALRDRVMQQIPQTQPMLRKALDGLASVAQSPDAATHIGQPLAWGRAALGGIATAAFVLVTVLYLLADGKRVYAWVLAYVPRAHRKRVAETTEEVSKVVFAYVRGQAITSLLFAIFVAVLLTPMKVPAVLALAIFAAVCDVIPVAGIIMATVPAALLAMTVSPVRGAIVVVAYGLYHFTEAYFIVPRVYGKELRLSTLAVILALVVGGTLQGILGAVLVLPIVAAYPIVERIWLKDYLSDEVIHDHDALEAAAEEGRDSAVDAVIDGAPPPRPRPRRSRAPH